MKHFFYFLIFIIFCNKNSVSQTFDGLDSLYRVGKVDESIIKAFTILERDSLIIFPYEILGQGYFDKGKMDSSLFFFNQAIKLDRDSSFISGWCHVWLGYYYFLKLNDSAAIEQLRLAILPMMKPECIAWGSEMLADIYMKKGQFYRAISFLKQEIKFGNDSVFSLRKAYENLGTCYINIGEKDKGTNALLQAISTIDKPTIHIGGNWFLSNAKEILDSIGYSAPLEPEWVVYEGTNISYRFQFFFTMTNYIPTYMQEHEKAYVEINNVFHSVLPHKLIFNVWKDKMLARKLLGNDLGYADVKRCKVNTLFLQSIGHEMAHVLAYYAWGIPPKTEGKFISEGIAVAFDRNTYNRDSVASVVFKKTGFKSVLEIWQHQEIVEDNILYPVAGAFVAYLYKKSSQEQFKLIVKDQTIENFNEVYGHKKSRELITGFDQLLE